MSNFIGIKFQRLLPQELACDYDSLTNLLNRLTVIKVSEFERFCGYIEGGLHEDLNVYKDTTALVIIDSISAPFKYAGQTLTIDDRMKWTFTIGSYLHRIALFHHVAILVINSMTTKPGIKNDPNSEWILTPSMGESWTELVHHRLVLFPEPDQYKYHFYSKTLFCWSRCIGQASLYVKICM